MKLFIGAAILALSTTSFAAERALTCKMSNQNGEISASLPLSKASTYEAVESTAGGLDAGTDDNYSFSLEMYQEDQNNLNYYETSIIVYENNNAADEVGSVYCNFDASKSKDGEVVCTEPMESDEGVVAQFACSLETK